MNNQNDSLIVFFFFQAEDGIRDLIVTGVQTCALPISSQSNGYRQLEMHVRKGIREVDETLLVSPEGYKPPLQIVRRDLISADEELLKQIGRASCRERV